MRAGEMIRNQIIYLSYVLDGLRDSTDAEVLRPVADNLRSIPDSELPSTVLSLFQRTQAQVSRWLDLGILVSRESVERILAALKDLHTQMVPLPPLAT